MLNTILNYSFTIRNTAIKPIGNLMSIILYPCRKIIVGNLFHHNSQVNDNRESNYDDLVIVLNSLSRLFNLILTVVLCEYLFYRSRMRDLESLSNYFT